MWVVLVGALMLAKCWLVGGFGFKHSLESRLQLTVKQNGVVVVFQCQTCLSGICRRGNQITHLFRLLFLFGMFCHSVQRLCFNTEDLCCGAGSRMRFISSDTNSDTWS